LIFYSEPPNNTEENSDTTHPKDSEEVRVDKDNQGDKKLNTQVSDIESKSTMSTEDSPRDSAASQNSQSDTQSTDRTEKQIENETGPVSVDNSGAKAVVNVQTVDNSPEVRQTTSEVKTSTPQTEDRSSRERYDSRISIEEEEAEFEEDKIMGKWRRGSTLHYNLFLFFTNTVLFHNNCSCSVLWNFKISFYYDQISVVVCT
jgi:hypothetical protein